MGSIIAKIVSMLGGAVSGPLGWLFSLFMDYIVGKLKALFDSWKLQKEKQAIADDNVKKDEAAMQKGDLDEIAKAGENLLNGESRNP